jgi:hypothetical protein
MLSNSTLSFRVGGGGRSAKLGDAPRVYLIVRRAQIRYKSETNGVSLSLSLCFPSLPVPGWVVARLTLAYPWGY